MSVANNNKNSDSTEGHAPNTHLSRVLVLRQVRTLDVGRDLHVLGEDERLEDRAARIWSPGEPVAAWPVLTLAHHRHLRHHHRL